MAERSKREIGRLTTTYFFANVTKDLL
ncbi:uncharacterized protein G2W53_043879 [Senna tora]|uniref:Uncharacterized protein n=1 Tax=Senna tora TaxID=362788 RepID=A0A834W0H6_9FABA|nr:uncharacterized protein G2W53_043879 [Senna tora]